MLIIVGRSRAINDDRSTQAINSLITEMGMIPRRAVLLGAEFVGHRVAWCDAALGDSWNAVVLVVIQHADAVPVNGCAVVRDVILDVHDDPISPVRLDGWTGRGAVEDEHLALVAIWSGDDFLGHEPVLQSVSLSFLMEGVGDNSFLPRGLRLSLG